MNKAIKFLEETISYFDNEQFKGPATREMVVEAKEALAELRESPHSEAKASKKGTISITESYKKGVVYNLTDSHVPKDRYSNYFENSDEDFGGEPFSMDRCSKSFKLTITIVS